jgi:phosphoglycerol transferase MdoB-like AlkP superfamily enzyme
MKSFNSPKLKYLYRLIFFLLITFSLYRIIFLLAFKHELTSVESTLLFKSFMLGARFDLRLAMALIIPAIIFLNLPLNPKFKEGLLNYFYGGLFFIINFFYAVDIGYYSYLRSRMNSTIISFLYTPQISLQMVQESYPWFMILLGLILMSAILFFVKRKWITPIILQEKIAHKLSIKISRFVLFFLVFALGLYGSLKMYPLRWSEAYSSTNAFTSNLSLNPILYVADTYSFRKVDYDTTEVKKYYKEVATFLGVKNLDEKNLNFLRVYPGDSEKQKSHPNVVVIIMESMAYYKTGLGGSKVLPTPYLDALKEESLLFNRFYTPTVATARSVFAAVTSLPDISKVQTGTRNPFIVDQNTIMGQAQGYEKFYFLGGSANWGNIRGILTYNIPDLKIYEEGSYKSPRVDVWGISDLDLFKEAAEAISTRESKEKPFFTIIQSAGFHRPYTIPENADNFKVLTEKDVDAKLVTKYGFESMAEFNAMRLQDYSLGRFFKIAKKTDWYDNTIFLVFGDHGLPHNNAPNVPEWSKFSSNGYHVPFLIHSKKYIQPGIESKIASEMDVMPTIAGLIGIPYQTRAFGRDLFNKELDFNRSAFSYNWYPPHHITTINQDYYFEVIPYNNNIQLIKHSGVDNTDNLKEKLIDESQKMEKLTKGLYEVARYLLHNNPKVPH